jgi:hypothetical protein
LSTYKNSLHTPAIKDAKHLTEKNRMLKVANDLQLEAIYQYQAIQLIDDHVIDQMAIDYFGDDAKENVFKMLDV